TKQNILKPNGSTFTASRGDDFLVSGDKNFRPINLRWGPDGGIYVIDWHDQNPCHQAKPDDWDYEHGRIYRIAPKGTKAKKAEDLGKKTDVELMKLLEHDNPYHYRTALRLISQRKEFSHESVQALLSETLVRCKIRGIWAAYGMGQYAGLMVGGQALQRIPESMQKQPTNEFMAWHWRAASETELFQVNTEFLKFLADRMKTEKSP